MGRNSSAQQSRSETPAEQSQQSPVDLHHSARNAMLEAMGDNEYYCASYSSKDQPHIDGLLMTLADGKLAKERDIAEAKVAGENVDAHEVARQTLHRLVSSTNRRMHKGFPEMLTYLLRKPTEYSSHEFVDLELFLPLA
eukprot:11222408-Karenia_brevis.AAC.1